MNNKIKQTEFKAECLSPGIAIGPALVFNKISMNLDELNYKISDIGKELEMFNRACSDTIENIRRTKKLSKKIYQKQFDEIFDGQIAILEDKIFLDEIKQKIKKKKKTAAFAIRNVFQSKKEHFLNLDNEYFRDRALDIGDLKQKLLYAIFGVSTDYQLSVPSIIFADVLTPSDTIHFNRNLILGFVTDTGGRTSHASIMAKSLHIPSVVNTENLSKIIKTGDFVIIDGYSGKIYVNPVQKTIDKCLKKKKQFDEYHSSLLAESQLPAVTKDNVEIKLLANVEFIDELREVKINGGSGIGLYRTEGLYFEQGELPSEEIQYKLYKKFSMKMGDQTVIIRTFDAGGDKIFKDLNSAPENNPFLGWRGIRVCLDETELFKTQLRAIYRANVNGNMKILLPMICCIRELQLAKNIIAEVKGELNRKKIKHFPETEIGIMVETPAVALMADVFMDEVDFFSIGTNDLTQYTLAVDRTNTKISKLFNDLHPAVLRLVNNTIKTCGKHNKEVSICGEIAGNPIAVAVLIGLGVRILSISPVLIPKIKKIIREVTISESEKLVKNIFRCGNALEVKEKATRFFNNRISEKKYLM